MMSPLPIVFIHKGISPYVLYTTTQARFYNPDSPIYLITDFELDPQFNVVEVLPMARYLEGAEELIKHYRHFSPNPQWVELFCFVRWIIMRNFLKEKRFSSVAYLDSDVMLYSNLTQEQVHYKDYVFTLGLGQSPHTNFISKPDILNDFCRFVLEYYQGKHMELFERLTEAYFRGQREKQLCAISDMTFFLEFAREFKVPYRELSEIIDGAAFDHNINDPILGYEMENGRIKLTWNNGIPYAFHLKRQETIRLKSIHLQDRAKDLYLQFASFQDQLKQ